MICPQASLKPPDVLILDLDLPFLDGLEILEKFQNKNYSIPVIVHSLKNEYKHHPAMQNTIAFIEKSHDSVDNLKTLIAHAIKRDIK